MKVIINQKQFLELMQSAMLFVPQSTTLQIIKNFKLKFYNNLLTVEATDLNQSIKLQSQIDYDGEKFEICVNAKRIIDIVKQLNNDIELIVDENNVLTINSANFTCNILGYDSRDFPCAPEVVNAQTVEIMSSVFVELIQKSSFCASNDISRESLCSVYFKLTKDSVVMVSTDGHRLASSVCKDNFNVCSEIECLFQTKFLQQIVKLLTSENFASFIKFQINEKYFSIEHKNFIIFTKLINKKYVNYKAALPEKNNKIAIIDKKQLIDGVRRVSILSNEKTHLISMNFVDNLLKLNVFNHDIGGQAEQFLKINYSNDNFTVYVNSIFFNELINSINSEKVCLKMGTNVAGILISPEYNEGHITTTEDLYLIMPLRNPREEIK